MSANSRPPRTARGRLQPASRSSGATARAVTTSPLIGSRPLDPLAASSARPRNDPHRLRQAESLDDLDQERRPSGQRLDQGDSEVGAGDGQDETGQTGAGADVEHRRAGRDPFGDRSAVEQVPVPDPGCLPGADQAADHAVGGQQFGVRGGQVETVTEEGQRGRCQLGRQRRVGR